MANKKTDTSWDLRAVTITKAMVAVEAVIDASAEEDYVVLFFLRGSLVGLKASLYALGYERSGEGSAGIRKIKTTEPTCPTPSESHSSSSSLPSSGSPVSSSGPGDPTYRQTFARSPRSKHHPHRA